MRAEFRWKLGLVIVLALTALVVLYPPLTATIAKAFGFSDFNGPFNGQPIRQGLDLKGGLEVILGPDYRVDSGTLSQIKTPLLQQIGQVQVAQPEVSNLGLVDNGKYDGLKFTFATEEDAQRVMNAGVIKDTMTLSSSQSDTHLNLTPELYGKDIEVTVNESPQDFPDDALSRAETIIKDRVNRLGLSEPDVRLDKENNRILVQLPDITDESEAENILQRTGRLNFRLNGQKVLYGDDLKVAQAGYDGGQVVINFEFGSDGASRLRYITTNNVGKYFPIYLDEEQLMNPTIDEPITNGRGVIRMGNATINEAKQDAILMQAGALPISLRNLSVNQVAPTLGKVMIRQSLVAGILGITLVIVFMVLFYGLVGTFADVALVLYAGLVLTVLALFRGVLTLPGVAGFILSIGMAVDANIIIFERIKDEIRSGKRVRPAIESGFARAFRTILDSNVTTLIIAGVLLFYGYGPVRGFAVTLSIGILVSMFTALVVTRLFLELFTDRDPDRFVRHFRA